MKKVLYLILTFCLALSLAACGNSEKIDSWHNQEVNDSYIGDYTGTWVWGQKYDESYDREITINSITDTMVEFDAFYYRTWSADGISAKIKGDNKAYFKTQDGVEGNLYIENNKLVFTVTKSEAPYVDAEVVTFSKDTTSQSETESATESKKEITDYSAANNYGYDSWQLGGDPYYANPLDAAGNTRKCAQCNQNDISVLGPFVYDYCECCRCNEQSCNKPSTVGWVYAYCDTHAAQNLCVKCFERERENGEIYCWRCQDD